MLAAKLRAQPRFRSTETPDKRIFRNQEEADAYGMYPFTKVTWDHGAYDKLEAAIRIIEPPLTAFLELLCKETTFNFQQEYEEELNYKLAELQVEARLKKAAALSAAAATATALETAKRAAPDSVQNTIAKINTKMTQLQRTQQRQSDKIKSNVTPSTQNDNKPPHLQKNMHGGIDKRPSAAPKAFGKDKRKGNGNRRPSNSRHRPNNKRKIVPETAPTDQSTITTSPLKKKPRRRPNKQKPNNQMNASENKDAPQDESNNAD
jgi:hypothetical protein